MRKKGLRLFSLLIFCLTVSGLPAQQEAPKGLVLEVILTTYDVSRTETLVYLRVFSDGHAEAHPMRKVDFRALVPSQAQVPATELAALNDFLHSSKVQRLASRYERSWGNKDFGRRSEITIAQGETKKSIVLENFQPFLARKEKKPYPATLEKLGCLVWELRTKVTGEPLEIDYLAGCRELGY